MTVQVSKVMVSKVTWTCYWASTIWHNSSEDQVAAQIFDYWSSYAFCVAVHRKRQRTEKGKLSLEIKSMPLLSKGSQVPKSTRRRRIRQHLSSHQSQRPLQRKDKRNTRGMRDLSLRRRLSSGTTLRSLMCWGQRSFDWPSIIFIWILELK